MSSKTYLQEKITGTAGQVVMINSSGEAEAQTKDFGLKPRLVVTVESGAIVTVTNGDKYYKQTSTGSELIFELDEYASWTTSATKGDFTSNVVVTMVDAVRIYNVELTFFVSTITVTCDSGSTVTCTKSGMSPQTQTSTGTAVFTVTEAGTYTIMAALGSQSAYGTVSITESGQDKALTLVYIHLYGVTWDSTSASTFSRTDAATNFTNPVPYTRGTSKYGSPFDTLYPWAGMVRVTDPVAGELVAIPKYYYKWVKTSALMTLQISDTAMAGFYVSPAHADRGDGSGERDIVYVGRYHCSSSDYTSATGVSPKVNVTRATARDSIHALGSDIWQYDFAMYWTIMMLYLVEFADWNSQAKIGYGCGNDSSTQPVGASDSMPYHTGTMQSSRTTYGVGCQYRYIEGLWENVYNWCDGIYYNGATVYGINNPSLFSDSANGTSISTRPTSSGWISAWSVSAMSGFRYALTPLLLTGSDSTYICDYCDYSANGVVLRCGGSYSQYQNRGLFYTNGLSSVGGSAANCGCRLQKLP